MDKEGDFFTNKILNKNFMKEWSSFTISNDTMNLEFNLMKYVIYVIYNLSNHQSLKMTLFFNK